MDYDRPRTSARSFGLGFISGTVISSEGAVSKVKENLNFRIQSARDMLMGGTGQRSMNPIQRRQEIRENRMDLLRMSSMMGGDDESGTTTTPSSTSGRVGTSTTTRRTTTSPTTSSTQSSIPSMSDVDRGTKKRAMERGYMS